MLISVDDTAAGEFQGAVMRVVLRRAGGDEVIGRRIHGFDWERLWIRSGSGIGGRGLDWEVEVYWSCV